MIIRNALSAILAALLASAAYAEEREEFLKVKKSTFVNLLDLLVNKKVIDQKEAQGLITEVEKEAAAGSPEKAVPENSGAKSAVQEPDSKGKPSKYVAYVPEFVKEDIRKQVRADLKAEVLKDVQAHAKKEKWGIPDALPDWISRIHPYVDMRLRVAGDMYQKSNASYFDWYNINRFGGISQALARNEALLNTTIDRLRLRERFRIGFDADIADDLKAGFRFATSNIYNPVSNNQTLGNTGQSWEFAIDRAFLQYDFTDAKRNNWFTVWGGRMPNPFMSTDVVYDPDLSFEGLAGTFRWRLNPDEPIVAAYHPNQSTGRFGINLGPQSPNSLFATAGVFPIQEINFSSADKWLFGGQTGVDWLVLDESRVKFAASYYYYKNISARRNTFESLKYDWTAPQFIQKGNSLVAINDAKNQPSCNTGSLGSQNVCLVGLASGFEVFNVTAMFDYAAFAPTHVLLTADFAKNFGFDRNKIYREFGEDIAPKTNAYQVRLDVGRPELRRFNDWSMYFAYRYIERDAVLDAFTDSVFHQGGTDAKGWVLGAQYGLATNTWLNLRWFTTDAISGPPFSIDTVTLDLNARL